MSSKGFAWFVAVVLVAAVVTVAGIGNGWFSGRRTNRLAAEKSGSAPSSNPGPTRDPNEPPSPGYVKVGGVWRPAIDVEAKPNDSGGEYVSLPDFGSTPVVRYDENQSTKLVHEALKSGDEKLGSRLSAMHEAKPFDRAAFEKDPQSYLDEIEPGRIWQSAAEGEGVKPIGRTGEFYRQLLQGESATLTIITEPNMPATFYSPSLGRFENQLTSITVRADEKGRASATFTAAPGSHDEVTVFAVSPVVSGQARFLFDILVPDPTLPSK